MSDLLKQAIADAKAVRATALSNAKAALEEHFAPKLQSMLSEKLKAEVAADEEGAEEALPVADFGGEEVPADAGMDAAPAEEIPVDVSVDAPAEAPMDAPVGSENPEAPIDGAAPVEDPSVAPMGDEELPVDEDTASEPGTAAAGNVHPGYNLTETEKASSNYKKTTSGHKTEDKGQEIVDATKLATKGDPKGGSTSSKASSNYKTMPKGNQVKNIKASGTEDPQGASNEVSDGLKKTDSGTAPLKENDEVDEASLDEILKELEASVHEVGMEEEGMGQAPCAPDAGADEELDLNELLSEDDDDSEKEEKSEKKDDDKDEDKEDRGNKAPWMKENISLKKELQEYRSAVVYLRDRINEVNLLNAKLLYTNRLFKQTSLNTEQKLKVIESFDLTKSVREAKLVYATLAESFNFGGKKVVSAPAKKQVSSTVKSITEGLASKQVASTKPTAAVLTEGAVMASRFQKLAGIRK